MATTYATEVKLFNKWSFDDIQVDDISLEVKAFNILLSFQRVQLKSCNQVFK